MEVGSRDRRAPTETEYPARAIREDHEVRTQLETRNIRGVGAALRARQVRIGLPKGSMQAGVLALLADAGIEIRMGDRSYRPALSWPGFAAKLLKPQNVVEMLHAGSRDVGFAGADWVAELDADLVELLDTGLDPVQVVAAAPAALLVDGALPPAAASSSRPNTRASPNAGSRLNPSTPSSSGPTGPPKSSPPRTPT